MAQLPRIASLSAALPALVAIAGGFGVMVVHYISGSPGDPEGWFEAAGFGAPFVAAGFLNLFAESTPAFSIAAGVALGLMSLVSAITIPLLIVAGFMIASSPKALASRPDAILASLFGLGLVGSFFYLVFHKDPARWSNAKGGGGSSNVVTPFEASLTLGVGTAVVVGSIAWSLRKGSTPIP